MRSYAHDSEVMRVEPLTTARWQDLEVLFGPRGACAGCWCMWWRLTQREFDKAKGDENRKAFQRIVESGRIAGLLAYDSGRPVGWCAVEPRERYPRLGRSRVLKPVDDETVWSIPCFFVEKRSRNLGIAKKLLEAAVEHARSRRARVVEGYPVEPRKDRMPDLFAFTGTPGLFESAGFEEVARRSESRPIMRRYLED